MLTKSNQKKADQLGMNPGTASNRLVKDILFKFVSDAGFKCHRCDGELSRDNFSIDHMIEWLDSDNPVETFFDVNNISYSHLNCNVGARRTNPIVCGTASMYGKGCRCEPCKAARAAVRRRAYLKLKHGA